MEYKIAFSPGPSCKQHIISTLRDANTILNICVFTISDDFIKDAIKAAFDRGVEVRIITDNYKVSDEGSDIEELSLHGIPVRVDESENHMHHKFMVADDEITITGSYNWTRSAERYNQENIVWVKDPMFAKPFNQEFEKLWEESSELYSY
jgi:phosphatidylserine/phosphatidylglycerophosphate/cardiolipin synthase-like enzyme